MNRIGNRLLVIPLLLVLLFMAVGCGNQQITTPMTSVDKALVEASTLTEIEHKAEDSVSEVPAKEAISGTEVPASEVSIGTEVSATNPTTGTKVPAKEATIETEATSETEVPSTTKAFTQPESSTKEVSTATDEPGEGKNAATVEPTNAAPEPQATVTISITGDVQKGIILEPTIVEWEDGDKVLDVLKRVTKSNRIPLEYRGSGGLSYIEGIANLYEFDQGASSGWLFKLNGEHAKKSAGAVKLSKGDIIEWIYSIELSRDSDE